MPIGCTEFASDFSLKTSVYIGTRSVGVPTRSKALLAHEKAKIERCMANIDIRFSQQRCFVYVLIPKDSQFLYHIIVYRRIMDFVDHN